MKKLTGSDVMNYIPDYLVLTGEYKCLLERTRNKQRILESCGLQNPGLKEVAITEDQLLRWYFKDRLGRPVATDIESYVKDVGYENVEAFRRVILREFCYLKFREKKQEGDLPRKN